MRILHLDCTWGITGEAAAEALADLCERLAGQAGGAEDHGGGSAVGLIFSGNGLRMDEIGELAGAFNLSARAGETFRRILGPLFEALAGIQGVPFAEAVLDKAGGAEEIPALLSAAALMDRLGAEEIRCSPLGVDTASLSLPAVSEILREHAVPVVPAETGRKVTPAGVSLLAALADRSGQRAPARVAAAGCSRGDAPLGAVLLESEKAAADTVRKLECNLDDMTGEALSYACEKLLEAGALDVWTAPIYMKKGRPGHLLSVLCAEETEELMAAMIFRHTSTIGVRLSGHVRRVMERTMKTVETDYGAIPVKESRYGEICKAKPEFDAVKKIAEESGAPLSRIIRNIDI